jgi:hypothetical protein
LLDHFGVGGDRKLKQTDAERLLTGAAEFVKIDTLDLVAVE